MHISDDGLDFEKQWERFRPTAYKPTPRDKWTCGYGHTTGVTATTTCTMAQALEWLREDNAGAENAINAHVAVPVTQNQFDALCSLVLNIGGPAFVGSTLLRRLNAGDYDGAADEFPKWAYQKGEYLQGLENRRLDEEAMFQMLQGAFDLFKTTDKKAA